MARARSSGGGGATAWLIVLLGFGFVICLVLSIVFYTQTAALDERAAQAESELRVFVSRQMQNEPAISEMAGAARQQGSVVEQLLSQNERLKTMIDDPQRSVEMIEDRVRQHVDEGTSLLNEMERIERALATAIEQRDQANQLAEEERENAQQARTRERERSETYDEQVAELRSELDDVTSRFEGYQQRVAEMERQLAQQVADAQRSRQDRVVNLESNVDELAAERDDLSRQIRDLTRRADPLDAPDAITADGRILSVQEQAGTAYIDLGRADGLVLGLTFEVFGRNDLVRIGEFAESTGRGKATVEVINIGSSSSRVRIVRTSRGQALSQGDQILNLVYDARARYRFYVYGDFDLDHTGEATAEDRQRVESTIARWGGRLADDLSYNVDYLVLGEEPAMPAPLPPNETNPVRIREHTEATRVYERYQALVAEARELSIPVLNQRRFQALTGYYQR